ncbi:TetR/AcrR family transcriptional regulator [Microbacterium mangrovi]|uniref:TetR/AcrR family transcriptional regulator n=1 Tax=Microbacterium mangrovi TaxID=1348253 RepID=UPI0006917A12|nr:TetR/AcrR family transcriptional regulator [Microbacterium mangrovi]
MSTGIRDLMADAAARLLAEEGYQATSFTEVLAASGAPRGSIYHHFPGGKDELVRAALERQADRVIGGLDRLAGRTPADIVDGFAAGWRRSLEKTDFAVGCSLVAVTASAGPGELRADAGRMFARWIARLSALFAAAGVEASAAEAFAARLLAGIEGAVAIARAQRSLHTFDLVVGGLRDEAAALPTHEKE